MSRVLPSIALFALACGPKTPPDAAAAKAQGGPAPDHPLAPWLDWQGGDGPPTNSARWVMDPATGPDRLGRTIDWGTPTPTAEGFTVTIAEDYDNGVHIEGRIEVDAEGYWLREARRGDDWMPMNLRVMPERLAPGVTWSDTTTTNGAERRRSCAAMESAQFCEGGLSLRCLAVDVPSTGAGYLEWTEVCPGEGAVSSWVVHVADCDVAAVSWTEPRAGFPTPNDRIPARFAFPACDANLDLQSWGERGAPVADGQAAP